MLPHTLEHKDQLDIIQTGIQVIRRGRPNRSLLTEVCMVRLYDFYDFWFFFFSYKRKRTNKFRISLTMISSLQAMLVKLLYRSIRKPVSPITVPSGRNITGLWVCTEKRRWSNSRRSKESKIINKEVKQFLCFVSCKRNVLLKYTFHSPFLCNTD